MRALRGALVFLYLAALACGCERSPGAAETALPPGETLFVTYYFLPG